MLAFLSDWDLLTSLDLSLERLFLLFSEVSFMASLAASLAASLELASNLSDSGEAMGAATASDFLGLPPASDPESVSSM